MKILWLTWKDKKNPQAGGAETVNEELAKRLVIDGHQVIFLVGGFSGGKKKETIDGYEIVRLGNQWSVYFRAWRYYKKNLFGWADLVIDEVNTIPFFAKFYTLSKEKNILFVHQLCREIWFYQMFFPLNLLGYLLEPIYLWLLRDRKVITVSQSTKKDLMRYGFLAKNIEIISEGIEIKLLERIEAETKFEKMTILLLGTVRAMKRTIDGLRAFEKAKKSLPELQLIIAGDTSGRYGKKLLNLVRKSYYKKDIQVLGRVAGEKRVEILKRSHLILVTSVKEGWGLIVTEANSQGTPAIVYSADGLRDSVKNGETGIVCQKNTPKEMAQNLVKLLQNKSEYERLRQNAWEWSKEINFEKSYADFKKSLLL